MKLQDLLAELRLNILNDRSDRTSGSSDYLWTDETLVRYINEAQRRFAVRSLIIRDTTTPEATRLTLLTGVSEYILHPSVMAVISAKFPDDRRDLVRTGHSMLNGARYNTESWDQATVQNANPGRPSAYATDEEIAPDDEGTAAVVTMRVFPTPSATENNAVINLRVVRKPLDDLVLSNLSAVPEIPSDHHLEMLDWAAYLALRIVDHDSGDAKRASEFAQSFETHVQAARTLVMRKLFAPQPWGFGRGGWSWGS